MRRGVARGMSVCPEFIKGSKKMAFLFGAITFAALFTQSYKFAVINLVASTLIWGERLKGRSLAGALLALGAIVVLNL